MSSTETFYRQRLRRYSIQIKGGPQCHCAASLWEPAGARQLEGKERSRGGAESGEKKEKKKGSVSRCYTRRSHRNIFTQLSLTAIHTHTHTHATCLSVLYSKDGNVWHTTMLAQPVCDVPGWKHTHAGAKWRGPGGLAAHSRRAHAASKKKKKRERERRRAPCDEAQWPWMFSCVHLFGF